MNEIFLLILRNYNLMLRLPFIFLSFPFSLTRNYSHNSKSYEVFVLALACCCSSLKDFSLPSGTNKNSLFKLQWRHRFTFSLMRIGNVLGSRMFFSHEFYEWCTLWQINKYNERVNRWRGPLAWWPQVPSPPLKHRRPPMKFRCPEVWFFY